MEPYSESLYTVTLKHSKTDQHHQGVEVYVGKAGCPLRFVWANNKTPQPIFGGLDMICQL